MRPLPADVPVHRGRVGAMGVAAAGSEYPAPYTFKPYVYRGTGKDTLTGHEPKPEPKPKRKRRDRSRAGRPNPAPYYDPWVVPETWIEPEPVQHVAPEPDLAPEQWVDPLPAPPVRPSPGWRPTSGAEIERMLAELEDE